MCKFRSVRIIANIWVNAKYPLALRAMLRDDGDGKCFCFTVYIQYRNAAAAGCLGFPTKLIFGVGVGHANNFAEQSARLV